MNKKIFFSFLLLATGIVFCALEKESAEQPTSPRRAGFQKELQAIKQRIADAQDQELQNLKTIQILNRQALLTKEDSQTLLNCIDKASRLTNEHVAIQQEYAQYEHRFRQYQLNKGIAFANHVLNSHHSHGATGATGLTG